MSLQVEFKIIEHGSAEYQRAFELREKVLRIPDDVRFTADEFKADKQRIHIAGFIGAEIVATSVLIDEKPACKMQRVVVKADLINRGIGTQMLQFCEAYAKALGYETMYCRARDRALKFYRKNGYAPEGEFLAEDYECDLKMRKQLL
jgi:ribosomal protein S18 acetylase RimI-like enzyme